MCHLIPFFKAPDALALGWCAGSPRRTPSARLCTPPAHRSELFLATETDGAKYIFLVLFLLFKECALLAVVPLGLQAVSIPENKGQHLMAPWCVVRSPGRVCMAPDGGQGLSWGQLTRGSPAALLWGLLWGRGLSRRQHT